MYSPYEAYLTFNRCFGVYDMECVLLASPIKGTFIVFSIHTVELFSILSISPLVDDSRPFICAET
jgi:hypothetical protein